MAPPRQRLIRRATLAERIKSYLNPFDFFLWLSEELNSDDLGDFVKEWSVPLGVILNVTFMIARANSTGDGRLGEDDVFGDQYQRRGSGWLAWLTSFVVHFLTVLSLGNAAYTFLRKRHYRLFEASIDETPHTPSARRVRVDSSPISSSPLRFFSNIIAATSAESRAHPDATRDVWELAVWDPTPICLRLFCLFSPGHIVVYWLFLPLHPLDPRPSVTVVTTIFLTTIISAQLHFLQSSFAQQSKDSTLIHKEVLHEYDTKYVHPSLYKQVRDVGTQTVSKRSSTGAAKAPAREVHTYTPTIYISRGFNPHPNPKYASHYDPDGLASTPTVSRGVSPTRPQSRGGFRAVTTPSFQAQTPSVGDFSSPIRPGTGYSAATVGRQPQFRPMSNAVTATGGDGGSFGVYSHASSPLKRTAGSGTEKGTSPFRRDISPLRKSRSVADSLPNGNGPNINGRGSYYSSSRY